jgi:antitoxin component of RelBE/YafQ-DinJ toxin-antitoxin module
MPLKKIIGTRISDEEARLIDLLGISPSDVIRMGLDYILFNLDSNSEEIKKICERRREEIKAEIHGLKAQIEKLRHRITLLEKLDQKLEEIEECIKLLRMRDELIKDEIKRMLNGKNIDEKTVYYILEKIAGEYHVSIFKVYSIYKKVFTGNVIPELEKAVKVGVKR